MIWYRISKVISVDIIRDKPVFYSLVGTVWRVLFAPISLFLIALKLTPELQGFYYLFFSIAGMQQVMEAGFSHTLVQSISHEMGDVKLEKGILTGKQESILNIQEAMRMGFSWYFIVSIFCIIVVYPIGIFIIGHDNMDKFHVWFAPWTVFIICFSINLALYPVNFFFEGILHLEKIYKNRLLIQFITSLVFVFALLLNAGLFCIVVFSICSFAINFIFLFIPNIKQFKYYLFKLPSKKYVNTIFKWQLKVSLVWCSGYLYWQLPTVIVFMMLGPVLSGQYSMTSNVINSVVNIGQVFIRTKAALIGKLRATNLFSEAYRLYRKYTSISSFVILLGCFGLISAWFLIPNFKIWERMLPFEQVITLYLFCALNMITLNQAMFARCSKEEPFFAIAMVANFTLPIVVFASLSFWPCTWAIIFAISFVHLVEYIWGNIKFRNLFGHLI